MKTRMRKMTVRGASVALLVSAGLLLLVARTQGSDPRGGLERDTLVGRKLQGAWNVTVNVCNNGPTLTRLNTFMFGGTMQEFAAFVSPPLAVPRGPGHGIWEHSTDGHYSYTVKFFVFNADRRVSRLTKQLWPPRPVPLDTAVLERTATLAST